MLKSGKKEILWIAKRDMDFQLKLNKEFMTPEFKNSIHSTDEETW